MAKEEEMLCPEDKKRKTHTVCKHRHYKEGEGWKQCGHYRGGCSHPGKIKKEK